MRFAGLLLVLAACHAQPAPVSSTPVPMAECPACPECPDAKCPEPPAPPEPSDWYCHDLERPNMPLSGFCRPSAESCESNRNDLIARKFGHAGPCTAQRTAYCFQISHAMPMTRQYMCARTLENCQRRQEWAKKNKVKKDQNVSLCDAVLNTDVYRYYPLEDEPFAAPAENKP